MHQGYWGEEKTLDVLDRFARFGLPFHLTETTLVSGDLMPPEIVDLNDYQVAAWPSTPEGEARQADEIVRHYRTLRRTSGGRGDHLLGHPTTAPGWRADRLGPRRRLAQARLRRAAAPDQGRLVARPDPDVTDEAGNVAVSGFLGEYAVTWAGRTAEFRLAETGTTTAEARVAL